jgi:hypothetical protein
MFLFCPFLPYPFRPDSHMMLTSCIYQILTDSTLNDCRIESFPDEVFIRRVGQHWAISTYNSSKCHAVMSENLDEHIIIDNEEVTLPEIALITIVMKDL